MVRSHYRRYQEPFRRKCGALVAFAIPLRTFLHRRYLDDRRYIRAPLDRRVFTSEQTSVHDLLHDAWCQEHTMMIKTTINQTTGTRERDLRQILHDRRRELVGDVRTRIRDARTDRASDVFDELDHSDAAMQEDMDFALIQMK